MRNDLPPCPPPDESIEIEQMVRLLCETANHFTISTFNGGVYIFAAWMRESNEALRIGEGPTLREALASACRHMQEMNRA